MKFKVLKDFVSSILIGVTGKTHDLELDEPTSTMWAEYGLIEEVKEDPAAEVTPLTLDKADATPVSDPTPAEHVPADVTTEQAPPVPDPAPAADTAPVDVTVDETK
jgi:hypothetical protein